MSLFNRHSLVVGLLFIIFASRMVGLTTFPAFIDETIHIDSASKLLDISPLYNVNIGRVLTIWWYALFQPTQSDPIWVARAATVIISMLGIAMMLRLSQHIAGTYGSLAMGLFILFSPYHYFFERLALADVVAASFVLVAIGMGYRLRARVDWRDAVLCGACLALGILAKVNVLPFAGVVLAAPVGFAFRHQLKALLQWFGVASLSLIAPIVAFEALVQITNNGWLGAIFVYVDARTDTSSIFSTGLSNILTTGEWLFGYMHPMMAIGLLVSVPLLLIQRRWYLFLVTLAPMLPMWFTNPQQSRYWLVPVMLLGLSLIIITYTAFAKMPKWSKPIPIGILLIWGITIWLPQAHITLTDPANIPIPPSERGQYVSSDAIGFGFAEIASVVPQTDDMRILGILPNCLGLQYTLWNTHTVICRTINPNGNDIPALVAWVEAERSPTTYVILEDVPYVPETISGTLLQEIEHASGRPRLRVYQLDN